MFSLKSELFKKQQELTSRKSGSTTAEIIRKQHKLKTPGTVEDAKVPEHEKNAGVEERNARDLAQTEEERDKSKMVKSVLEAKSKLYDKMTSGDILPDEESSAVFLVDFEKKSIDARMKRKNIEQKPKLGVNVASELAAEVHKASNPEEEWVEYTDGLGRTRRCLRKDLPEMKRIDQKLGITKKTDTKEPKTLLSDDMRREMEREKWEEEALEELNGPVHYESLRAGEIRELGVGYYAFSTDQETREKQIKMLQKMREDTEREKRSLKETENRKRSALQARLERVRLGRIKKLKAQGKEIPDELLKPIQLPEIEDKKLDAGKAANDDVIEVEVTRRDDSDRPVREWDEGKDWTPAELPKPPKSWKDPREERPEEFAPPSFYYKGQRSKQATSTVESSSATEDAPDGSRQDFEEDTASTSRETPSDLISRIRKELSDVAKSSVIQDNTATSSNSAVDNTVTSTGENFVITNDSSPNQTNVCTEEPSKEADSIATSSVENADLYVPCPDKPISMKVKVLPKKNSVLSTKSAFGDG